MSSQSGELKNYATDFHLSMLIKQKREPLVVLLVALKQQITQRLLTMKWLCLHVALTIYLLAYLIAAQLSSSHLKLLINGNLETLVVSKDLNQAVMINSNANSLTSILKESLKMARGLKLMRAVHIIK